MKMRDWMQLLEGTDTSYHQDELRRFLRDRNTKLELVDYAKSHMKEPGDVVANLEQEIAVLDRRIASLQRYLRLDLDDPGLQFAAEHPVLIRQWFDGWMMAHDADTAEIRKVFHAIRHHFPVSGGNRLLYRVMSFAADAVPQGRYAKVRTGIRPLQSWTIGEDKASAFHLAQQSNFMKTVVNTGRGPRTRVIVAASIPAAWILMTPETFQQYVEFELEHDMVDDPDDRLPRYAWQREVVVEVPDNRPIPVRIVRVLENQKKPRHS